MPNDNKNQPQPIIFPSGPITTQPQPAAPPWVNVTPPPPQQPVWGGPPNLPPPTQPYEGPMGQQQVPAEQTGAVAVAGDDSQQDATQELASDQTAGSDDQQPT